MSKRVLVVEDSATIRKTIELALTLEDYQLEMVETPRAALDKIQGLLPDLLICDVSLPEMDGYKLSENIIKESKGKKIPILLLVGSFEAFDKDKATAIGIDELMIKPFESTIFIEKTKELIEKGVRDIPTEEVTEAEAEEIFEVEEEKGFAETPQTAETYEAEIAPAQEFKDEVLAAEVVEETKKPTGFDDFQFSEQEALTKTEGETLVEAKEEIQVESATESELFETVEESYKAEERTKKEPEVEELFTPETNEEPFAQPEKEEAAWDIMEESGKKEALDVVQSEAEVTAVEEEAAAVEISIPTEEAFIKEETEAIAVKEAEQVEIAPPDEEIVPEVPEVAEEKIIELIPEKINEVFETKIADEVTAVPEITAKEAAKEEEEIVIKPLGSMLSNEVIAEITEKAVKTAVEEVVWGVVPELIEEIKKIVTLKIQEIAWAVIPEIAEKHITDEIAKLKKEP